MSRRVSHLDALAQLEEERDDLLASLDRLDDELAAGEIDEADHRELTDDVTRRAAEVIRKIDSAEAATPRRPPASSQRRLLILGGLVAVAVLAGVAVAASSGLRRTGEFGTGGINSSSRDLLVQAQLEFGQGNYADALDLIEDVLGRVPGDVDALALRARVEEQSGELLQAAMTLDLVLASEPDNISALTQRGWILVRLPDEELQQTGIELLDRAIAQDPVIFDPYLFRAITAERIEADFDAARGYYEEALARNPPTAMVPQIENFIAALPE